MKLRDLFTQAQDWPESRFVTEAFGVNALGHSLIQDNVAMGRARRVCLAGRCIEVAGDALMPVCGCATCRTAPASERRRSFDLDRFRVVEDVLSRAAEELCAAGLVRHDRYSFVNDREGHGAALLVLRRAAALAGDDDI